eukprot:gene11761-12980_t
MALLTGQLRIFPYNTTNFVQNQDDAETMMFVNPPLRLKDAQYSAIFIYTNGYVSFPAMHNSATPNYPRSIEILAPFWTDLDFRNSSGGVAYSLHQHTDTDSFSQMIINKTSSYISARTNVNFSPTSVILVTWIKALPKNYSSSADRNETVTFQLHLAMNNINTYASFIYEDGGMLWKDVNQVPQMQISSYNSVAFIKLGPTGTYPFYRFDTVVGNTGNANKFTTGYGIGVGLGWAVLIVVSVAVAVIYKRRKQNQGDITKDVKPVSNEKFEMEA